MCVTVGSELTELPPFQNSVCRRSELPARKCRGLINDDDERAAKHDRFSREMPVKVSGASNQTRRQYGRRPPDDERAELSAYPKV